MSLKESQATPLKRHPDHVMVLDQRLLPFQEQWIRCEDAAAVEAAIRDMAIRGAPAIGIVAAHGLVLGARRLEEAGFDEAFDGLAAAMNAARPTAVNLAWAIRRMQAVARKPAPSHEARLEALDAEAREIEREDLAMNHAIGEHGASLVPFFEGRATQILTHCNTGSLATAGWGTALGMIRSAHQRGAVAVYATETRPYLQGARLTSWELRRDGVDVTLIADHTAPFLMSEGKIDLVVVGADRITRNGDTINKIGTLSLAVAAHHYGVPFYVAAPTSTLDLSLPDASHVPIEARLASEVLTAMGHPITENVPVYNPVFDRTPYALVDAIITEHGVFRAPYETSLSL